MFSQSWSGRFDQLTGDPVASSELRRLLDLAIQIQQIGAPTGHEQERAAFVLNAFSREGLKDVDLDGLGNVYGRLPGGSQRPPLIISAHLDTVFPGGTACTTTQAGDRIEGPGIGDNSLGVAALLGLVWALRQSQMEFSSDVWLVANVGEEGLGNLRGMKQVTQRFGGAVLGYVVVEGTALGHVYHRAVGSRRYRVTARTAGGHSWSDYGQPSAIHELSRLVTRLTSLPVPTMPRTTLNVGVISGGTGVNVLAAEAHFELDVRSEGVETLAAMASRVESEIQAAQKPGVDLDVEVIGERPAGMVPADHPLVRLAVECLAEQGIAASLTAGSTDANVPLSLGYPAIVLGITTGGGAHTLHEYINIAPIPGGMAQLVNFVERLLAGR